MNTKKTVMKQLNKIKVGNPPEGRWQIDHESCALESVYELIFYIPFRDGDGPCETLMCTTSPSANVARQAFYSGIINSLPELRKAAERFYSEEINEIRETRKCLEESLK